MAQLEASSRAQAFPYRQIFALTFTNFSQSMMYTMPFTVAVFMVRGFLHGQGDEQTIGRMTGMLAGCFSFAQFTTSFAWGLWSNRFGRKPVLVIGSAFSAIGLICFGLAPTYAWAAGARILAGLFNGIIGAWKCMIGESYESLLQGRIMSIMALAWGLGCVAGPSVGGLLSQPCVAWPALTPLCGPGELLAVRPYLLPCAAAALVCAMACLVDVFALEETLPAALRARDEAAAARAARLAAGGGGGGSGDGSGLAALAGPAALLRRLSSHAYQRLGSGSFTGEAHGGDWSGGGGGGGLSSWLRRRGGNGDSRAGRGGGAGAARGSTAQRYQRLGVDSGGGDQQGHAAVQLSALPGGDDANGGDRHCGSGGGADALPQKLAHERDTKHTADSVFGAKFTVEDDGGAGCGAGRAGQGHGTLPAGDTGSEGDGADAAAALGHSAATSARGRAPAASAASPGAKGADPVVPDPADAAAGTALEPPQKPWYHNHHVILALACYGAVSLLYCTVDELTPIFASAPLDEGGLAMSEQDLAGPFAFNGAALLTFSLLGYPPLQRLLGTLPLARVGIVLFLPTVMLIPLPAALPPSHGGGHGPLAHLSLYTSMLLKAVSGSCAFTGAMVLVNVSSHPAQLGAVNGAGQSLAALARGTGPALGGLLWGAATHIHSRHAALLPFGVVTAGALAACALFCAMPTPPSEARSGGGGGGSGGRYAPAATADEV